MAPSALESRRRLRWRRAQLLSLAAALGTLACGYRVIDPSEVFGPEVRGIQLQMLENRTTEVGLEAMLSDAFQEEFARRGLLRPVYSDEDPRASLVLTGNILSAKVEPTAFSSVALSLEDRVDVLMSVTVQRTDNGKSVIEGRELRFGERFLSSTDPQVYESNKEQALRRIAARAASQLHDELFQQF
jgi:hypothetical protein